MALNIPTNRAAAPAQNASDTINPSRYFGNKIAAPMALPNVPQGMGGFVTDTSAEVAGLQKIGNAITGVVDDLYKKERALRKANETLAFAEAGQAHQSEWLDKQAAIKKMLYSGEIDAEGAKAMAKKDIEDLNLRHFGPDKFKDEEIQLNARVQAIEITNKYDAAFKKDIVIPYQTSKYVERMDVVTNNAIQTTSDSGRVGTFEDGLRAYDANRNTILNTYNSVDAAMLLDPDRLVKDREKKIRDNARGLIDGILARDYVQDKKGKYDPVKGAQEKLKAIAEAQHILATNQQLRVDIGVDADNTIKRLEDQKAKQLEFIQRQQDLQEKRAERQQKQAEKLAYTQIYSDLVKNGIDSRYMNEQTIIKSGVDPIMMSHLLEKKRSIEKGELNFDQSYRYVENAAKNGFSMARPDKQSAEYLDNHYSVMTRNPSFQQLPPEQQATQIANTYASVGWLPEKYKNDISKWLRSSNPAVVNGGILQLQKLEQADSRLLAALTPEDKAFYINRRDGMPIERAAQLRDAQATKSEDDIKRDDHTYMNAIGAKKDFEAFEKNKTDFEKRVRSQQGMFESNANIPKSMIESFNTRVRAYAPLVGFDMKRAQEMAFKDTTSSAGVSSINGAKTFMMNAPEAIYRGVKQERLQAQFTAGIDELKAAVPALKDKPIEDFGIVQDARFDSSNPKWQITVNDGLGNFIPLSAYTPNSNPVYFKYDPTEDIAKNKAEQEKAINKALKERQENIEGKGMTNTNFNAVNGGGFKPRNAR